MSISGCRTCRNKIIFIISNIHKLPSMTVIDYDVPVIDFVWNFHGKFFPHHFTDTVTFYTYLDILLRVHGSASQGRLYKHCVIPGLYSCTQCTHPGYCDADRVTPGGGTRAMPRMSRNGWYLIRAPAFLITWARTLDISIKVSGSLSLRSSDRHWFKWT